MRIRITYKQKYRGKILTDSYVRTVKNHEEIIKIKKDLYSDPHVVSVDWEEVAA